MNENIFNFKKGKMTFLNSPSVDKTFDKVLKKLQRDEKKGLITITNIEFNDIHRIIEYYVM